MPKAILFGILLFASATFFSSLAWVILMMASLATEERGAMDSVETAVLWAMATAAIIFLAALVVGWLHYRRLNYNEGNTAYPMRSFHLTLISCIGLYFLATGAPGVLATTMKIVQILQIDNHGGFTPIIDGVLRQLPDLACFGFGLAFLFFPRFFYRLSIRFHDEGKRLPDTGDSHGDPPPCDAQADS